MAKTKKKELIENKIYAAIIGLCEEKEHEGVYRGNGHHFAQQLVPLISEALLTKQQRKVYDALTTIPMPTKDIAKITKIPSKNVSAILIQMKENTLLVHSSQKTKKLKLWYKQKASPITKGGHLNVLRS